MIFKVDGSGLMKMKGNKKGWTKYKYYKKIIKKLEKKITMWTLT